MDKKIKNGILIVLIFVLIGPLVINLLFKFPAIFSIFVAEWDAGSALSYYGSIIAAILGVIGVFLTIQYTQRNYKEDTRKRVLPFIAIEQLKTKNNVNLMTFVNCSKNEEISQNEEGYREYKMNDYYCILEHGDISYQVDFSAEQKELIKSNGIKLEQNECCQTLKQKTFLNIPIEIENVGNGSAIRLRMGINKKDTEKKKFLPPISLKQNTPIVLHIFCEDCNKSKENYGDYVLSFIYEDIYDNCYEQNFEMKFKEVGESIYSFEIDMSHKQDYLGVNKIWKD